MVTTTFSIGVERIHFYDLLKNIVITSSMRLVKIKGIQNLIFTMSKRVDTFTHEKESLKLHEVTHQKSVSEVRLLKN